MKRDYSVEDIFDKFIAIYNCNIQSKMNEEPITSDVIDTNNKDKVENKNKKTNEEKREEARIRKQKQRQNQKEKYGDEEYKKKVAAERAARRKNAKENK